MNKFYVATSLFSLVPRPHPAFRRLQYGKAGRPWYLFPREHDVIGKLQKFAEQAAFCVFTINYRSMLSVYCRFWFV